MPIPSHRLWVAPFLAATFLLAPALWAPDQTQQADAGPQLVVESGRPDALYRRGEPIGFNLRLLQKGQPVPGAQVIWTLTKDGAATLGTGALILTNGAGVVEGRLDEPGFVQCRVTYQPPAGTPVNALGGAGVDPLKIQPSLPAPADFDAFWDAQKKKLAAVPVNPRLTSVNSPVPGVSCFDLQADCVGAPVSGYFARPEGARPKSLPIILTLHGAGVRSSSLSGPAEWAARGFLAMDINAHGLPNGRPASYYTDLEQGELKGYQGRGRESRESFYFLGMFLRVLRAVDFLASQPEWNGRTLVVYGGSQGGAQALVAAGLDRRVSFYAAGVPALCDHSGAVVQRIAGWPKIAPSGAGNRPDPKVIEMAQYYDMMNFGARIRVPGLVTVGFIDATCPPSSVYAAYNAIPGDKKAIFNDPTSPHRVTPAARQAMDAAVLAHAGIEAKKSP